MYDEEFRCIEAGLAEYAEELKEYKETIKVTGQSLRLKCFMKNIFWAQEYFKSLKINSIIYSYFVE